MSKSEVDAAPPSVLRLLGAPLEPERLVGEDREPEHPTDRSSVKDQQLPPLLPALRRDPFVANVLWVGVCLLCQGTLGRGLDFRGSLRSGEAYCEDGQGDEILVLWDEQGVLALVVDDDELPAPLIPPPPSALQGLTERALSRSVRATSWLWICGDSPSPRPPPRPEHSLLGLIDYFCGPSLISSDDRDALERALFDAIVEEQGELTEALAAKILDLPEMKDPLHALGRGKTRLEAARAMAEELKRFGLLWSTVERDVARWS